MSYKRPDGRDHSLSMTEMRDRLVTIDMGRKVGAAVPLLGDRRRLEAEATAGHKH